MLIVRALDTGAYSGAAVVGAFFALFVWQSGTYFWRNRPGHYRPDALPTELVPNGQRAMLRKPHALDAHVAAARDRAEAADDAPGQFLTTSTEHLA